MVRIEPSLRFGGWSAASKPAFEREQLQIGNASMHRCSSELNLGNAPNPQGARRLQLTLGGETHETDLYPCRPCHAWRRRAHGRNGHRDARHESRRGVTDLARPEDGPRLQRLGSLLGSPVLRILSSVRLALLASPLLWWL